jgi:hypothetical protein
LVVTSCAERPYDAPKRGVDGQRLHEESIATAAKHGAKRKSRHEEEAQSRAVAQTAPPHSVFKLARTAVARTVLERLYARWAMADCVMKAKQTASSHALVPTPAVAPSSEVGSDDEDTSDIAAAESLLATMDSQAQHGASPPCGYRVLKERLRTSYRCLPLLGR